MSLRDYFDQRAREGSWGALYDGAAPTQATYNFLTRRQAVFELLEQRGPFESILDVGCGTGDYAGLADRHGGHYHGVDFAPEMVRAARERAEASGRPGRFVIGAGDELPYADGAFDLVVALGYIAYFRDPRRPWPRSAACCGRAARS